MGSCQGLRLPDGEAFFHHLFGRLQLQGCRLHAQQRPGVAGGELPFFQHICDGLLQRQQPQGVGHGGAALAHGLAHGLLGQAEVLHQGLEAPGLLHGVQVLPLQVFHQRQLLGLPVVGLDDAHGHFLQSSQPGSPPAPLAGDDLIVAGIQLPHGDGLQKSVLSDGIGQFLQCWLVKACPGLSRPGLHLADGQLFRRQWLFASEQGPQARAQRLFLL